MKSRDSGSNRNILGVDTDRGKAAAGGVKEDLDVEDEVGGVGYSCGGGIRVRGIPPQDTVDACIHITKSYYPLGRYNCFTPIDNQKVWKNKVEQPRASGEIKFDTSMIK